MGTLTRSLRKRAKKALGLDRIKETADGEIHGLQYSSDLGPESNGVYLLKASDSDELMQEVERIERAAGIRDDER